MDWQMHLEYFQAKADRYENRGNDDWLGPLLSDADRDMLEIANVERLQAIAEILDRAFPKKMTMLELQACMDKHRLEKEGKC